MEAVGSNPSKGEDFSYKILIWRLTKKAPILIHDAGVSSYDRAYDKGYNQGKTGQDNYTHCAHFLLFQVKCYFHNFKQIS